MATVNNWVNIAGRSYIDVAIPAEDTDSDIIAMGNRSIVALETDSDFAGSAITFESGALSTALSQYNYETAELSITISASLCVGFDVNKSFPMTGYVKLVSGTQQGAGTPSTIRVFAVDWKP